MKMQWFRGQTVGRGRFGTVSLAIPSSHFSDFPPIMAVKSCHVSDSESLRTEKSIISDLAGCPEIIRSFGDDISYENGSMFFNLFLEYAGKGSLVDLLKNSGGTLENSDVKRYTKSILKGLCHIHDKGFAHCDIKLENILVFEDGSAKIADFGLAKRVSKKNHNKYELKGTPLYMAPELVLTGDGGFPADIWALGCIIVEMVSGKPAWDFPPGDNIASVIFRIGMGKESPAIPANLCPEGKDFLGKCFVRDPNERWTARMLLEHPFISGFVESDDHQPSISPKGPFDISGRESTRCSSFSALDMWDEKESSNSGLGLDYQLGNFRGFGQLVRNGGRPDWCDSNEWIIVR